MALMSALVPQTWADLADEIGPAAALALSAAYGGVNIYVPGRMSRAHAIARLFEACGAGFAAAMTLSELYGDTTIHVPKLSAFWRIQKAAQAVELLHSGATHEQAAEALGISVRTLHRTLAFARELSLQARRRRDSRRLRSRAAAGALDSMATQMGSFGDQDIELQSGQSAAGMQPVSGDTLRARRKEVVDARAHHQDPRDAGHAPREGRRGRRTT